MCDVLVVGAGAAGLMAAGRAGEAGARVLLLEKNDRPGRKLLITGKGRCNISNNAANAEYMKQIHQEGRFLRNAFGKFFHQDIILLLGRHGLKCVLERGGRYFPSSGQSADVVDALTSYLEAGKVETRFGIRVSDLLINDGVCKGVVADGSDGLSEIYASSVIIATGGMSYPATGSSGDGYRLSKAAGHSLVPVRPALVPLETAGTAAQEMQGLSLKNVRVSVWVDDRKAGEEFGEMLFTHFGLSGPVILSLSRLAVDALTMKRKTVILIDLKPALDEQQLDNRLLRDINQHGKKKMHNLFREWLPSAMIPVFLSGNQIEPSKEAHQLTSAERRRIALMMKNMRFEISGHRSFKEAIITAGGISTKEVDHGSMESKLVRNLYFAGEILDLDANTGGYNLQIAWSTGYLAGEHAAKADKE